jgi:hypothetical protein
MTCKEVRGEKLFIESEMARIDPRIIKTHIKNAILGAAGCWLLVPWFFIDLSGADKAELESLARRYSVLKQLELIKCEEVE